MVHYGSVVISLLLDSSLSFFLDLVSPTVIFPSNIFSKVIRGSFDDRDDYKEEDIFWAKVASDPRARCVDGDDNTSSSFTYFFQMLLFLFQGPQKHTHSFYGSHRPLLQVIMPVDLDGSLSY